jgi:hypothetical protein
MQAPSSSLHAPFVCHEVVGLCAHDNLAACVCVVREYVGDCQPSPCLSLPHFVCTVLTACCDACTCAHLLPISQWCRDVGDDYISNVGKQGGLSLFIAPSHHGHWQALGLTRSLYSSRTRESTRRTTHMRGPAHEVHATRSPQKCDTSAISSTRKSAPPIAHAHTHSKLHTRAHTCPQVAAVPAHMVFGDDKGGPLGGNSHAVVSWAKPIPGPWNGAHT